MNINGKIEKYFDVVIESNKFYIVETLEKQKKHGSAVHTLNKIVEIIEKKLEYAAADHQDKYSKLSRETLVKILKQRSSEIANGYKLKTSTLNPFNQKKQINMALERIENPISPSDALRLPKDLITEIFKYLETPDIATFTQVNRDGRTRGAQALLKRAREFGYEGNDHVKAIAYIKALFKEVQVFCSYGYVNRKYFSFDKQMTINSEKTLENLKNLTTEDIFSLFSNESIYSPSFQKLRKLFNVKRGAIVKECSDHSKQRGNQALLLAAKNGEKGIVELLLQHGAEINAQDPEKQTPLALATIAGAKDVVAFLIKQGADVNTTNIRGNTPLICSTQASPEITQLLLESGAAAKINEAGYEAETALHFAAENSGIPTIELLLQHGANINARNRFGQTPLALATLKDRKDIVEFLITRGADVNTISTRGNTPLIGASHSSPEITRLLLAARGTEMINHAGSDRMTALHFAAENGAIETIELLLQHGADINARDQQGRTPLALAILQGREDIVAFLIKKGADVNTINVRGSTPLMLSMGISSSHDIIYSLLEAGAIINCADNYGSTALHSAVTMESDVQTIALLLQYKANVNAKNGDDQTPLELAIRWGRGKVIKLLKRHQRSI